ncbi:MAG: PAS domain-containing protein [Actinobacteria bacterium]|nr:PAS domain-containing protein [Actinomycetota bacterium]
MDDQPLPAEPGQPIEADFRTLIERIPAVAYIASTGTPQHMLYVSPQVQKLLGHATDRWLSEPALWLGEVVHPDDRAAVEEASLAADTSGSFHCEYRAISAAGGVVWVRDAALLVRGGDGSPLFWEGVMFDVTAEKEAERWLRASEAKYRALVEQLPAVVYIDSYEPAPASLYVSPSVEQILGRPPEWYMAHGEQWTSTVHPGDRERVIAALDAASASGEPFAEEYRFVRPDGSVVWVSDNSIPILDEDGKPIFWQGVLLDITHQKETQEALRRSEERHRALVEGIPAVVYEMGPDDERRTLYVSRQVEDVLGYSRREWLDQPDIWVELLHPDDREIELAEYDRHNETGEPWAREYRLIASDGRAVWVSDQAVLIRDDLGHPLIWQGVMLDITAQKELEDELRRANDDLELRVLERTTDLAEANEMMSLEIGERRRVERELRETQERYRDLIEQLPAVVYMWEVDPGKDGEPSRDYISPQIEQLLGFAPEEWIQEYMWYDRIHPHDLERVTGATARSEATGRPFSEEYRYLARDGHVVWVLDQARMISRDKLGQPKLFQGVFLDITARKAAEDKAVEAEARYRQLAEIGPIITYALERSPEPDAPGMVTYISPRVERILGYAPKEWVDGSDLWMRSIHPDDRSRMQDMFRRLGETVEPWSIEYRLIARDGRIVWVHDTGGVLTRDDRGRGFTFQGAFIDITASKETESILRESEERYRSLVEGVPAIPWIDVTDVEGHTRTVYVGPQIEHVLGYLPDELIGEPEHFQRMIHPDDRERVMALSDHCNETSEPWDIVYRAPGATPEGTRGASRAAPPIRRRAGGSRGSRSASARSRSRCRSACGAPPPSPRRDACASASVAPGSRCSWSTTSAPGTSAGRAATPLCRTSSRRCRPGRRPRCSPRGTADRGSR